MRTVFAIRGRRDIQCPMRRRSRVALAGATLALLLPAAAAQAGTISADGTTITYVAAPGEKNFITVNWGNSGAGDDFIPSLDDHADIVAGANCEDSVSLNARCPSAGPNPTYVIRMGDGDDFGQSINDRAAGHRVEFYGE